MVQNVRVDGIKAKKAWMKIDMFEQFLCEAIASILPECNTRMDIVWTLYPIRERFHYLVL